MVNVGDCTDYLLRFVISLETASLAQGHIVMTQSSSRYIIMVALIADKFMFRELAAFMAMHNIQIT